MSDMLRAMERLEAQLRRAADDLADSIEEMRTYAVALTIEGEPDPAWEGRCGRWMPRNQERCFRFRGHRDACRSRLAMRSDAARRHSWRRDAA